MSDRGAADVVVRLSGYPELLAVHRALMEAKFREAPNDPVLLGSPLLADVANRVVDALIGLDSQRHGSAGRDRWVEWRQLSPERREWKLAIQAVSSAESWSKWSQAERRSYVITVLAPFTLDDPSIEAFLEEIANMRADPP
jgi:hypothetical protein